MHRGVRICRAAESGAQRSNFNADVRVDADIVAISGQDIDTCIYIAYICIYINKNKFCILLYLYWREIISGKK